MKITGMKELQKALNGNSSLDTVKKVVKLNGSEMARNIQRKAPVDTGTMKRSVDLGFEDGGMTAEAEPTAEYSGYVEWGTRFAEAQPFVKPAFEEQVGKFKQDLNELFK